MNRRITLLITVISLLCIGLGLSAANGQQKTLKDEIVGAWTLVSNETITPEGSKQQPFGDNPKGILILDSSGRYASVFGRPDRPKFKAGSNRSKATAEEWAAAAQEFVANSGTWSVSEADKVLVRKYEIALIPNNDRNELKASVNVSQDQLKLTITTASRAKNETVYQRIR
jgi:hypothetical protein